DVNRRQADTAAPVDRYPLAGPHLRAIDHAVIGGHEAAAHRGALFKADIIRHRHEVGVGVRDADIVAVAAPVGEAGEHRIGTDMGLAAAAIFADAVALAEGHQHAVALFEVARFLADFLDYAAELMAHHQRHRGHQSD